MDLKSKLAPKSLFVNKFKSRDFPENHLMAVLYQLVHVQIWSWYIINNNGGAVNYFEGQLKKLCEASGSYFQVTLFCQVQNLKQTGLDLAWGKC